MGGRGFRRRMLQTLDECVALLNALINRYKKSPGCVQSYIMVLITAEYSLLLRKSVQYPEAKKSTE
jgi:hypothetical protein